LLIPKAVVYFYYPQSVKGQVTWVVSGVIQRWFTRQF